MRFKQINPLTPEILQYFWNIVEKKSLMLDTSVSQYTEERWAEEDGRQRALFGMVKRVTDPNETEAPDQHGIVRILQSAEGNSHISDGTYKDEQDHGLELNLGEESAGIYLYKNDVKIASLFFDYNFREFHREGDLPKPPWMRKHEGDTQLQAIDFKNPSFVEAGPEKSNQNVVRRPS